MNELLHNYRELVARTDELSGRIVEGYRPHIACRAGCDGCCRHLSIFWVEAASLAAALAGLPARQAGKIRDRARESTPQGPCPLLDQHRCVLYAARPIICRTHGLPLLNAAVDGTRSIDFCPANFQNLNSLPGTAVIDTDRLTTALAAVNALFVTRFFGNSPPGRDRITIGEALLMRL